MTTLLCKWAPTPSGISEAESYLNECNQNIPGGPGVWAVSREDKYGNIVIPLLGPPWVFTGTEPFPEPPSCFALRQNAVVVSEPEWPEPDPDV